MSAEQVRLAYIVAGFIAFAFLYRRREAIGHAAQQVASACLCAAIAFVALWKLGLSPLAAYIVALVTCVLIRRAQPSRARYISPRTKRQAIAKWEKETGQTFNRRLHELDHVLAHSRGGGNAEDNLRVLTRKQNRSKGAR